MKDFFAGFQEGMKKFGGHIAVVVNALLLLVVYIFGVGVTSLVAKILGKKFLSLDWDRQAGSYWQDLRLGKEPPEHYYRQF